jgi:hypothetical protein
MRCADWRAVPRCFCRLCVGSFPIACIASCDADHPNFEAYNPSSPSSFSKRGRTPSASSAPQNALKRVRAHDLEKHAGDPAVGELFAGPDSWANLRKLLASGGWRTRAQQATVVPHDSQMGLGDVSTHIHEAGMYAAYVGGEQRR